DSEFQRVAQDRVGNNERQDRRNPSCQKNRKDDLEAFETVAPSFRDFFSRMIPVVWKIGPARLLCSPLQARMNVSSNNRVGMIGSVQSTRKNHPGWDNPRDCQTVRPLNYENRKEIVL